MCGLSRLLAQRPPSPPPIDYDPAREEPGVLTCNWEGEHNEIDVYGVDLQGRSYLPLVISCHTVHALLNPNKDLRIYLIPSVPSQGTSSASSVASRSPVLVPQPSPSPPYVSSSPPPVRRPRPVPAAPAVSSVSRFYHTRSLPALPPLIWAADTSTPPAPSAREGSPVGGEASGRREGSPVGGEDVSPATRVPSGGRSENALSESDDQSSGSEVSGSTGGLWDGRGLPTQVRNLLASPLRSSPIPGVDGHEDYGATHDVNASHGREATTASPADVEWDTEDEEYDDGPYPNEIYNADTYDMESEADFPWDEVLGGDGVAAEAENTEADEPRRKRRRTA